MKHTLQLFLVLVIAGLSLNASSQDVNSGSENQVQNQSDVTVYYFHKERRCETCRTVEIVSKKAVADLYEGRVKYKVYNLDGERGKSEAKKLKVAGQALIIVKGDIKIDITADSFRYVKKNPERVRAIIKEKTDSLLK